MDDPDTLAYLNTLDEKPSKDKEETAFKFDINELKKEIKQAVARTLGEYLCYLKCKRNRKHNGGHLRTDRQMYQDELDLIWQQQKQYFPNLPDDFMTDNKGIKQIVFYQRPLKLNPDRVGKCSLEPRHNCVMLARLEAQRFRYLQNVNNLQYFERHTEQWLNIGSEDRQKLIHYFEHHPKITVTELKKLLGFDKSIKINLDSSNLKGNITACEIRAVLSQQWDNYSDEEQLALLEDLLSITKKTALKTRLMRHWKIDKIQAIKLCLLEFEPGHGHLSLKAINKLLPFLEQGLIYSKNDRDTGEIGALQAAGYQQEVKEVEKIKTKKTVVVQTRSDSYRLELTYTICCKRDQGVSQLDILRLLPLSLDFKFA